LAKQPDLLWTTSADLTVYNQYKPFDYSDRIRPQDDGGVLLVGPATAGYRSDTVRILELDCMGIEENKIDIVFEKISKKGFYRKTIFNTVSKLQDGGYLIAGDIDSDGDVFRELLGCALKVSADGEIVWYKEYPEVDFTNTVNELWNSSYISVKETCDGNIIASLRRWMKLYAADWGYYYTSNHDLVTLLAPNGHTLWEARTYYYPPEDTLECSGVNYWIDDHPDSGYISIAAVDYHPTLQTDFYDRSSLLNYTHFSSNGDTLSTHSFGESSRIRFDIGDVQWKNDNQFVVFTYSYHGDFEIQRNVTRINMYTYTIWPFSIDSVYYDYPLDNPPVKLAILDDNSYLLSFGNEYDIYEDKEDTSKIICLSESGELLWEKDYPNLALMGAVKSSPGTFIAVTDSAKWDAEANVCRLWKYRYADGTTEVAPVSATKQNNARKRGSFSYVLNGRRIDRPGTNYRGFNMVIHRDNEMPSLSCLRRNQKSPSFD
jgi:hypothetical protein